jgi:thiol-disulfide isomerase/thioredoxin
MARSHRWRSAIGTAAVLAVVPLLARTPGDTAPAFMLKTLDGSPTSLSDHAGHPVLINFWASWCKPCRGEMPLIIAAYQAHQQAGLAVLAIDLTSLRASRRSHSVFVGADGVVRGVNPGPIREAALQHYLYEILPAP